MLSSVNTKTMASSRFGNEDPNTFTEDNLREQKDRRFYEICFVSFERVHECSGQTGCRYFIVNSWRAEHHPERFFTPTSNLKLASRIRRTHYLLSVKAWTDFLKDNDKKFDIISDSGFDTANNCCQSLLRKTRQVGKGAVQHHEAISRDDLQKLYKHPRALTPDIPLGLLKFLR